MNLTDAIVDLSASHASAIDAVVRPFVSKPIESLTLSAKTADVISWLDENIVAAAIVKTERVNIEIVNVSIVDNFIIIPINIGWLIYNYHVLKY
ncbi:hypothetical protein GIV78_31595 [Pseudomonas sp. PA-3-6H]|nr:hypothetical protein [Pseudomonas sp. PA-3-6H]